MAGKEPIVSVIVPVYNTQSWLAKCLNSLLNQTLREIEIILVDDGSTDYSAAICGAFAESDSRIRFYQQENRGVSAARNLGLQYARGKYVMFCDSDDFVGEDYCRLGVWYAERYPDVMVDMGRAFVDARDEIVEQQFWDRENT
ncbi:MAG: glycosyltransferase, partial [Clostridiales bacterium]|nr:glycosyltransferase [Clostridiales bacterium]